MLRSKHIHRSGHSDRSRRGSVLIIVLVVIVVLALAAYNFASSMVNEQTAVDLSARQIQARMQVDSGVDLMRIYLTQTLEDRRAAGGLYDNPARFQSQLIVDDEDRLRRGRVSILSSALDDNGQVAGFRFGFGDESARLNLNSLVMVDQQMAGAGRRLLMALPGMTEEQADAILDFIDPDDEPREFGAEIDYYSSLEPPYAPRNGPLETVEELLLVRGITPELLFGGDTNRNGLLDVHEQAPSQLGGASTFGSQSGVNQPAYKKPTGTGPESSPTLDPMSGGTSAAGGLGTEPIVDSSTLELGWSPFLTLYGMERNMRADGQPRIDLTQADLTKLYSELSAAVPAPWATFIVAYRLNGPYTGSTAAQKNVSGLPYISGTGKTPITQILDLIGAKTQAKLDGSANNTVIDSPFENNPIAMAIYMPLLMDACTVNPSPIIPGRININQAPEPILRGIPGITEEVVQEILSSRSYEVEEEKPNRRFETWLLVEGIVDANTMRTLMPFICGGGDVYRAQVVGYFDGGGPSARAEVVLDASGSYPRVLFWRDLSHLGRGFALETLGIEVDVE